MLADHTDQVLRAFGLGSRVVDLRLAGTGEQGQVWRLKTTHGVFAIKETFRRENEPDASAAADFQEAVFLAGTVPVPRPLRALSGRTLAEIGPHQVRAYEWVDLLPMNQAADPVLIGATVAAVHRVNHEPARPLHPWYTEPVHAQRWSQLHSDAVAAGAPFAAALADEIPTLIKLAALMEPPERLQNCHRDLWADNILPMPAGGVCVIDWDNCGLEDPAQELPMVLFDFAGEDVVRMRDLLGSYVDSGGPARLRGRGAFTMVIAQFGHFWESAVAAYLSPNASADLRAHSIERANMLLSQPLRLDHIDNTLDAVAGIG
ncbi:MAG: aminoglycoside phosphotransferase [Propionibacteriaceae bacterium]|nr:aminoglycoside phosphotransferase [Propionibacteriaceae bacterium]